METVSYGYTDSEWGDLLTSYGGKNIDYDAIGNPLSDGTWTYTWKHGRQLASMTSDEAAWVFTYNADGLRTKRTDSLSGNTYTYVYDGSQLSYLELYDGESLYFTYADDGRPFMVWYDGEPFFYVTNLQGDVVALLDATGTGVVSYSYDAWGKLLSCTGTMADTIGTFNPLRYRGYVYDTEIGLYYVSSRYYDPEVGRWLNSDDPMFLGANGNIASYNLFVYCENNPINMVDLTGNVASNVIGAVIGGVLGAIGGYVLTNWLANNLGLTGWKRNLFVWGLSALIGASAAAIGYFVGPYIAKVWYALRAKLSGFVRGLFKSIQNITSAKMKHINVSKHLWNKVLGKQTSNVNIKNLIYRAIRNGEWQVLNNGTIGIHWKYAGQLIEITGNVVNGVFKVGNAWVWNGISKLLF